MLPTYIINLPQDTLKRESMERQLQSLDMLNWNIVDAVYGKSLSEDSVNKSVDQAMFFKRYGRNIALPEIGCTLSHKKVYDIICRSKDPVALVLEDDAKLDTLKMPDIEKIADYIAQQETPLVVILTPYFQYYMQNKVSMLNVSSSIYRLYSAIITAGYIINLPAARLINNISDKIYYTADDWKLFVSKGLHLYGCVPHLVSLNDFPSGIKDSVLQQNRSIRFPLLHKIKGNIIYRFNFMRGKRTSPKNW